MRAQLQAAGAERAMGDAPAETRWERRVRQTGAAKGEVVGVHAYRDAFNQKGHSVLSDTGSYGIRRMACYAPFVALPAAVIATRAVPVAHRPVFWIATLLGYGVASTVMYNTDASSYDDPTPPLIVVSDQGSERG